MPPIEHDWEKTPNHGLWAYRIIALQSLLKERDCGVEVHDTMHILQVTEEFPTRKQSHCFRRKKLPPKCAAFIAI